MTDVPREMLCCARLEHGGWCVLLEGHEGEHEGHPRRQGPEVPDANEMLKRRYPKGSR